MVHCPSGSELLPVTIYNSGHINFGKRNKCITSLRPGKRYGNLFKEKKQSRLKLQRSERLRQPMNSTDSKDDQCLNIKLLLEVGK